MAAAAAKRPVRSVLRLVGFVALTAALLALCAPTLPFGWGPMRRLRRLWCRGTCRLLGVRATLEGAPSGDYPTLFVANHVSYLDVVVLGSFVDATFVAKSEVAGWPLFGLLGRVTRTLFVKRHWRQALVQRDALAARLRAGESFILFGEGTSTNGLQVRRFKTSLLSVAEPWTVDRPVAVQPAALAYVRLADGTPFGPANCDLYAWHSDAELVPHLWDVLRMEGVEVRLVLGEPVPSWSVRSRKLLGPELRDAIERAMRRSRAAPRESAAGAAARTSPVTCRARDESGMAIAARLGCHGPRIRPRSG
jgi:1-acyl-sn-glycerol-3-phosphate acyltransferase